MDGYSKPQLGYSKLVAFVTLKNKLTKTFQRNLLEIYLSLDHALNIKVQRVFVRTYIIHGNAE